jgi:hypothetical protein
MAKVIENAKDAIEFFGEPVVARRKTKVRIRETNGVETFVSKYGQGTLTAKQGIDYVVIPVDGSDPYPCKIDIFHNTWEEIDGTGTYRKTGLCRFIPIPEGTTVELKTLEGPVEVSHPNYIALGAEGEVYSYSKEFIEKNLDLIYVVFGEDYLIFGVYSTLELAEKCKGVKPGSFIGYYSIDVVTPPDFLLWQVCIFTKTGKIDSIEQIDSFSFEYVMRCAEQNPFSLFYASYCFRVKAETKEEAAKIAQEKFKEAFKNDAELALEKFENETN